jgi:hypothetical protein
MGETRQDRKGGIVIESIGPVHAGDVLGGFTEGRNLEFTVDIE